MSEQRIYFCDRCGKASNVLLTQLYVYEITFRHGGHYIKVGDYCSACYDDITTFVKAPYPHPKDDPKPVEGGFSIVNWFQCRR